MREPARSGRRRRTDTLAKLEEPGADTWVATASTSGRAHLVPLSYAWDGECVVLAAEADSLTVRNLHESGRARLGFGPTRDVALVDAELDRVLDVEGEAAQDIAGLYAAQADWDPRLESERYVFILLRPHRVQAWRESNELAGRLLMRDGEWIV